MKILNIKNMGELVPNYPEHWLVAIEHQPEFKYRGKKPPQKSSAYLWYHMEPSLHSDTLTEYLYEKWGVTDRGEALQYVSQWNDAVKHGLPEIEFEAVFSVGYGKMGVITDSDNKDMCMLFGFYNVYVPRHVYSGPGRGGYAWQRLVKEPLKNDEITYYMLSEKFALWSKQGRGNLIKFYNRLVEAQ